LTLLFDHEALAILKFVEMVALLPQRGVFLLVIAQGDVDLRLGRFTLGADSIDGSVDFGNFLFVLFLGGAFDLNSIDIILILWCMRYAT
jgi:hypothetical protein